MRPMMFYLLDFWLDLKGCVVCGPFWISVFQGYWIPKVVHVLVIKASPSLLVQ